MDNSPVQAVAARIDEATRPSAAVLIAAYFDPSGPFPADTFDTIGENDRNCLGADDLLAVTLLDVRIDPPTARLLLGDDRAEISAILMQVPDDVDLWDATDNDLAGAATACDRLGEYAGIGPVVAGKLLARKRPRLVPVVDRIVIHALRAPENEYWTTLRECLADQDRRDRIEALRPEGVPAGVSTLRLFDVAVWMEHSDNENARRARRDAETRSPAPS